MTESVSLTWRAAAAPMFGRRSVDESCAYIVAQIAAAARAGAQVVVFPENATDSYQREPEAHRTAIERWLPEIEAAAGRAAGPWVVLGTYTYRGPRAYNSALVIDPDGRTRGVYDKLSEGGARWLLADIQGARCVIMICADFWVPGVLTIPRLLGAQVCLYPHGSGAVTADRRDWSALYYTRAWESGLHLVMADCAWVEGAPFTRPTAVPYPYDFDHHLLNQSCLISPEPRYLARAMRDEQDGLLVADLAITPPPPDGGLQCHALTGAWQAMLQYCQDHGHIAWLAQGGPSS